MLSKAENLTVKIPTTPVTTLAGAANHLLAAPALWLSGVGLAALTQGAIVIAAEWHSLHNGELFKFKVPKIMSWNWGITTKEK